jgi:hypothetical protein
VLEGGVQSWPSGRWRAFGSTSRFGPVRFGGLDWLGRSGPSCSFGCGALSKARPVLLGVRLSSECCFSRGAEGGHGSVELGCLHSCRFPASPRRVLQGRRGEKPHRGRYRPVPVWREAPAFRRQVSGAQPGSPLGNTLGCLCLLGRFCRSRVLRSRFAGETACLAGSASRVRRVST